MYENYPIFAESCGGLTRPLHRITFPSCRFCNPESFPLRTLRESGLWWSLTPTPNFVCLTGQLACIQYKAENASARKTGDAEFSWKLNFEIFACCEGALFDYFVCLYIYFWRRM